MKNVNVIKVSGYHELLLIFLLWFISLALSNETGVSGLAVVGANILVSCAHH